MSDAAIETTTGPIAKESVPAAFIRVLGKPYLRSTALRCIASIFRNFFFLQYKSALLPGLIPVSRADHPMDEKIPFLPGQVNTYLDFVAFWVRMLGFLLKNCGRQVLEPVKNFIKTMGSLYEHAAEVYRQNLSTTNRPFYIKRPRFLLIHLIDPHLMCIPSLHVMVVIRTYTFFKEILRILGEETRFTLQAEELRRGAINITEAVLYVKQHSVNCIPAALYAMTCFDPRLFPPDEAEQFTASLFSEAEAPGAGDAGEIRKHIITLYKRFLSERETASPCIGAGENTGGDWKKPLLDFLKELQEPRQN